MKSNNLLFSVAATALMATFAACSNDLSDVTDSGSSNIRFTSKVIDGAATRGGTNVQTSQLESGLQVGLFSNEIENADNVALTADGNGGLSYTASLQWPATGNASFYAYAPYVSDNAGKLSSGEISFAVADDQSTDENYKASDLLYGAPASNPVSNGSEVALAFTHKLSKVIVKLTTKTSTISNPTISLTNVVKDVTLNVADGKVTAGDATGTVTVGTFTDDASSTSYACAAVIAPQTVKSGVQLVSIEMDGKTYTCSLGADKEFKEGNVYTITVAFDGAAIAVTATTTLTAWVDTNTALELVPYETVVYGVGDYLLADGNFVKKEDVSSAASNVIGVIFSKTVSATDAANYDAYILYIGSTTLSNAVPQSSGSLSFGENYTVNESLTAAAADLDGLTQTKYVQSLSDASSNYPLYDLSALSSAKPTSGTFSDWFIPSIGQLIQIVNNLGNAGVPTDDTNKYYCVMPNNTGDDATGTMSFGGKTFYYTKTPGLTALKEALKEATNNTEIISSKMYASSSYIKNTNAEVALLAMSNGFMSGTNATDDNKNDAWGISSGDASSSNARGRVACIAAKLP